VAITGIVKLTVNGSKNHIAEIGLHQSLLPLRARSGPPVFVSYRFNQC